MPRLIQRWNGHVWEPHGFAADLAEAKRVLYPEARQPPTPAPAPTRNPLRAGPARHRKPPPTGSEDPQL